MKQQSKNHKRAKVAAGRGEGPGEESYPNVSKSGVWITAYRTKRVRWKHQRYFIIIYIDHWVYLVVKEVMAFFQTHFKSSFFNGGDKCFLVRGLYSWEWPQGHIQSLLRMLNEVMLLSLKHSVLFQQPHPWQNYLSRYKDNMGDKRGILPCMWGTPGFFLSMLPTVSSPWGTEWQGNFTGA